MEQLLLSDALEQFLQYLLYRKKRSQTTITTYRSMIGFFIESAKDCEVSLLTVEQVDAYASDLIYLNLKPKSYRNRLVPIRSFVKFLYMKGLTNIRPDQIDVPPDEEQEANFLTAEEQKLLINACKNPKEKAIIKFLLRSGVRISELLNAKTDDLYDRSLIVAKGKGGKPRVTFITERTLDALNAYRSVFVPQTYLFPNRRGGKMSRQYVTRLVSEIAERAGIQKRVSCHTLRHTFATNLLMNGARIEDVQPMMGHKNIRTTQIYMHFTNDYLHGRYDEFMGKSLQKDTLT